MAEISIKTYEYKIKETAEFVRAAEQTLGDARFLWNCALEQKISAIRRGNYLTFVDQMRQLTEARELPWVKSCLRAIQEDVLTKLDYAFTAWRKRRKNGDPGGFPRFKNDKRYRTFAQRIEGRRENTLVGDVLTIPGIGKVRLRLSRPIEGKIKQIRVTRRADGWYALLVCEMPLPEPLPKTGMSIGVDVGINTFAALSDGQKIENPRWFRKGQKKLKRVQQAVSRKKRGSNNRKKAVTRVGRVYQDVQRQRRDFLHKVTFDLVERFDHIVIEKLNVGGMGKGRGLAKSIHDAGWSSFFRILIGKAENAGRRVEKVSSHYTSQDCSSCKQRGKVTRDDRVFNCLACGVSLDRDVNAAINILGRGTPGEPVESHPARGSRKRFARAKVMSTTDPGVENK